MTNRMLWIGIPLLMLAFLVTGVVVNATGRASKMSAGDAQPTASVMDGAKSCCATQDGSGDTARTTLLVKSASAKPHAVTAKSECVDGEKASCDHLEAGNAAECPYRKKIATNAALASLKGKGTDSTSNTGVISAKRNVVKSDTASLPAVAANVPATK